MSTQARAHEVAESSCSNTECPVCRSYVETGEPSCRPVSKAQYLANLAASYPSGIPTAVLPTWAQERAA